MRHRAASARLRQAPSALLRFAPPLRVTAPVRRDVLRPWPLLRDPGRMAGPVSKDHGGQRPEPRGGSRLAEGDPGSGPGSRDC